VPSAYFLGRCLIQAPAQGKKIAEALATGNKSQSIWPEEALSLRKGTVRDWNCRYDMLGLPALDPGVTIGHSIATPHSILNLSLGM
jgi:hypothetical protein